MGINMKNLRKYGDPPFTTAVLHGGPGAPGEMSPVAQELSTVCGVLEPLQTSTSLDGQVQELKSVLTIHGSLPVTLLGFSWGAMLGFIFTAHWPSFVKKLILVSSGVYDEKYAKHIMETRLSRLSETDRASVRSLMETLNDPTIIDKNTYFARFGELISKADSYDPLPHNDNVLEYQYNIFEYVWRDVEELRQSGTLLELGKQIQCPVLALHGDSDPHPGLGVKEPLSGILKDFQFILLSNCGHRPWIEREARDRFYEIIKKTIGMKYRR